MKELKFDHWNGRAAWPTAGLLLLGFSLLSSNFELLVSEKKFFWKNEPKLCPSLLTIVKKRTQNEPK
jgi:hypothetical protein